MGYGLSLQHSVLVSYDSAYGRVMKTHVITDFFEGVMVDDMRSMDRPISG